jgi:hypothetical protein
MVYGFGQPLGSSGCVHLARCVLRCCARLQIIRDPKRLAELLKTFGEGIMRSSDVSAHIRFFVTLLSRRHELCLPQTDAADTVDDGTYVTIALLWVQPVDSQGVGMCGVGLMPPSKLYITLRSNVCHRRGWVVWWVEEQLAWPCKPQLTYCPQVLIDDVGGGVVEDGRGLLARCRPYCVNQRPDPVRRSPRAARVPCASGRPCLRCVVCLCAMLCPKDPQSFACPP